MGWRYHGLDDVVYERRTLLLGGPIVMPITAIASALGNRRRRQEAERVAAPQWRPLGPLVVEVRCDRLLVSRGDEPGTVWLASVTDLRADAESQTVDLYFEADPPFRFQGPDSTRLWSALEAIGSEVAGRQLSHSLA
ncbi:MAG: hypothetical protein ACRDZV_00015 [Acidimicrobiia bacterium]